MPLNRRRGIYQRGVRFDASFQKGTGIVSPARGRQNEAPALNQGILFQDTLSSYQELGNLPFPPRRRT